MIQQLYKKLDSLKKRAKYISIHCSPRNEERSDLLLEVETEIAEVEQQIEEFEIAHDDFTDYN